MNRYSLTQDYLKNILYYNPETGIWTWLYSNGAATLGKRAGCLNPKGYLVIRINGHGYEAQLLAYLYMEGSFPPANYEIDHIDKDVGNNRYYNYRLVTKAQNQWNSKISSRNTTGIKGLTMAKVCYLARVVINGTRITKRFPLNRLNEAVSYLTNLRNQLHGEFANHG
jgi:HNH endonuclease